MRIIICGQTMSKTQTVNLYERSVELVERFAQCLLKDCQTENDLISVEQLAHYVAYFSNESEMTKMRDQIYENFISMIDSSSEKPDFNTTLKQFNEEIDKATKQSNEKCKNYTNFMKMISTKNLADNNDCGEIKTISETVSTIDPISKLPIVEPVKNKNCGHTYEKTTILQLIGQNRRTKCPIAGCNATNFVRKNDLVPDNALKRMLTSNNFISQKKLKLNE